MATAGTIVTACTPMFSHAVSSLRLPLRLPWMGVFFLRSMPSAPVTELAAHAAAVNGVQWAPHSSCHICTGGDDSQALIWDLSPIPKPIEDPILAYTAEGEINQLRWSSAQPDWVAIAFDSSLQVRGLCPLSPLSLHEPALSCPTTVVPSLAPRLPLAPLPTCARPRPPPSLPRPDSVLNTLSLCSRSTFFPCHYRSSVCKGGGTRPCISFLSTPLLLA
jgi:hypothetical protein